MHLMSIWDYWNHLNMLLLLTSFPLTPPWIEILSRSRVWILIPILMILRLILVRRVELLWWELLDETKDGMGRSHNAAGIEVVGRNKSKGSTNLDRSPIAPPQICLLFLFRNPSHVLPSLQSTPDDRTCDHLPHKSPQNWIASGLVA
jgi:hypothetical protein